MTFNEPPLKDSWSTEIKTGPRTSWSLWFTNVWKWIQAPTAPTQSPGDNTTAVATDAFVTNAVATGVATAIASGIGYGQSWQDLTVSRVFGTTYTNSTGKPISVNISATSTSAASTFTLTINGVGLLGQGGTTADGFCYITAIIPVGATYVATLTATATLTKWHELR